MTLLDHVERSSSADEKPKRILAGDELRRLLAAIDPDHRLIFETAAETGAPLAETLRIVWREVDLDAETITFSHQLDSHGARIPLKTKRSRRTIEVTPSLIAKLREHKLAGGPHDLMFVTRAGTPHDHRNVGGRVMARAVKRAGLQAVSDEIPAPTFPPSTPLPFLGAHRPGLGSRGGQRPSWPRECVEHAHDLRPRVRRGTALAGPRPVGLTVRAPLMAARWQRQTATGRSRTQTRRRRK